MSFILMLSDLKPSEVFNNMNTVAVKDVSVQEALPVGDNSYLNEELTIQKASSYVCGCVMKKKL